MLERRTIIQMSLAAGTVAVLAALGGVANWLTRQPYERDGWYPIDWPFLRDAFPPGRAWRGHDLEVYVRPKLGLCGNGETNVVTDEEVDRVSDIDLLDPNYRPLREGRRIRITDMFGRSRLYRITAKDGSSRLAEAIAVSYNCDLVVAIVIGKVDDEATRKFAHAFIETNKVQVFVNKALEGR